MEGYEKVENEKSETVRLDCRGNFVHVVIIRIGLFFTRPTGEFCIIFHVC